MSVENKVWEGPPVEAWAGAWDPQETARRLSGCHAAWCVVGGWAVDLFLGRKSREHGDLEVGVPLTEFHLVAARLKGLDFYTPYEGEVRAMPAGATPTEERHQTWIADPATQQWRIDVMAEPGDAATWAYRRDPSLTASREFMVARTASGIPYLRPHGTLLFKAKAMRPKDEADFAVCAPLMRPAETAWLAAALERLHPDCPWRQRLEAQLGQGDR